MILLCNIFRSFFFSLCLPLSFLFFILKNILFFIIISFLFQFNFFIAIHVSIVFHNLFFDYILLFLIIKFVWFFINCLLQNTNINSILLFFFLSLFLSSTRGNNNSRFLTPAYSHLLLSFASTHRFSLLLCIFSSFPSSLFFIAHSCSLFPSRDTHFHSFTPRTLYHLSPSLSLLFADVPPLNFYFDFSSSSLFFSRHLFSLTCPPFLFVHLSLPLCAPLSLFCSRILLILRLHAPSRSCFWSCRFCALLSSPAVVPLYPRLILSTVPLAPASLSSRSIELRSSGSFYLTWSTYFLLFLFFCAFSLLHLSLSFSHLPFSLDQVSLSAARLVLSLSLW